jgi:Flp pilus assembly secretin CpaC
VVIALDSAASGWYKPRCRGGFLENPSYFSRQPIEIIMRCIATIFVVLALSVTAYGQNDPSTAAPKNGNGTVPFAQPDTSGKRLQELRQKADELFKAGKHNEAWAVHKQADQERNALMHRCEALQAEARQIRKAVGPVTQVLLHLQVYEVSPAKLQSAGYDAANLFGNPDKDAKEDSSDRAGLIGFAIRDDAELQKMLDPLLAAKAVKVLAEPRLVTLSGFSASFCTGSVKMLKKNEDGSTTVVSQPAVAFDIAPDVMGDIVHLWLRCRSTQADEKHSMTVGNETIPGVRVMEMETATESRSGKTLVIGGMTKLRSDASAKDSPEDKKSDSADGKDEKTAMLVLVRPEIVRPMDETAQPTAAVLPPSHIDIRR